MSPRETATTDPGRLNRANVVLTGPPRSGTTLACRLLNALPDTVALHEPISPGKFADAEDDLTGVRATLGRWQWGSAGYASTNHDAEKSAMVREFRKYAPRKYVSPCARV